MAATEKHNIPNGSFFKPTHSNSISQKVEEFDLEEIKTELLLEEKELEEYRLYSKIALAGLWISFLLAIVNLLKALY